MRIRLAELADKEDQIAEINKIADKIQESLFIVIGRINAGDGLIASIESHNLIVAAKDLDAALEEFNDIHFFKQT